MFSSRPFCSGAKGGWRRIKFSFLLLSSAAMEADKMSLISPKISCDETTVWWTWTNRRRIGVWLMPSLFIHFLSSSTSHFFSQIWDRGTAGKKSHFRHGWGGGGVGEQKIIFFSLGRGFAFAGWFSSSSLFALVFTPERQKYYFVTSVISVFPQKNRERNEFLS